MKIDVVKKEYDPLVKKHALPTLAELESEFHISYYVNDVSDLPENVGFFIVAKMMEYTGSWISFLHNLVVGNSQSIIMMQETSFFSDEEKAEMTKVMTRLVLLTREQTLLNLDANEQSVAEFLKRIFTVWKECKHIVLKYAQLSKDRWVEYEKSASGQK
jgi:hypothetical protein